jgi:hypothetical protein
VFSDSIVGQVCYLEPGVSESSGYFLGSVSTVREYCPPNFFVCLLGSGCVFFVVTQFLYYVRV